MNKDNHIGLFALAFIILAVAVCITMFALDGCKIDDNSDVDWVSLSEAIQDYRANHGYPTVIETTCCWYGSDYIGSYKYAQVVFTSWTTYFYCYTSGIYADDGWFW